jgi:Tfp pilus assembly protein PilF
MRVFISYRRSDSAGHAGRLYDSLQAHFGRDNVFMDLSAIDSGQNFVDAIETAVRSCDALVAIIGDDWLSRDGGRRRLDEPGDFVRSEIAAALSRGIPVVPVLVEDTKMPSADALPDVLKPLATRQAHELSDVRWSHDVERLIDAIEKLGRKSNGWAQPKRLALGAAIAIVAIVAAFAAVRVMRAPQSGDAAAYAERATQHLASGDYDRAIADLDAALELDPRAESYYNRGLAYFSKNAIDRAIADWNTAINLDPRNARSFRQRGNAYYTKGDFNLAVADYNRAIELEPQDAKAHYNRGLVFQSRDERARAIADFTAVVTLGTDPQASLDAKARLQQLASQTPAPVTTAGSPPPAGPGTTTAARADVAGEWVADVKYSWGDQHPERFTFNVDGDDVFGTASFLRVRRGIVDGMLTGNVLQFRTQSEEILGDQTRTVTHRYRGRVSGDVISFFMQSEGASSSEPIEFMARRADDPSSPKR